MYYALSKTAKIVPYLSLQPASRALISNIIEDENSAAILQDPDRRLASILIKNSKYRILAEILEALQKPNEISTFVALVADEKTEEAQDLLNLLLEKGFLVPASSDSAKIHKGLSISNRKFGISINTQNKTVTKYINSENSNLCARLKNEACILSYLNGKNINFVPELHSHADNGLSMEVSLIKGVNLSDFLEKSFSTEERIDLCNAILTAYMNLHTAGVLHGDISLNNILCNSGEVFLVDFELATHIGIPAPSRKATTMFCSPEIARNITSKTPAEFYTIQSEIFSIASMLFYILGNCFILDHTKNITSTGYLQGVASGKYQSEITSHSLQIHETSKLNLFKMLAYDPNNRPASLNGIQILAKE